MSSLIQTSESNAIVYISSTNFFSRLITIIDSGGDRSSSNIITISTVSSFTFADGTFAKVIDTPYASLTLDAFANVLHQFPFSYGGTTDAQGITIQGNTTLPGITDVYDSMYIDNSISSIGTLDGQSMYIGSNSVCTRTILMSSIEGLGHLYTSSLYIPIDTFRSSGYVLSNDLYSTVAGLGETYVSSASLQSTVNGLGTFGYMSIPSLVSTVTGLNYTYILRSNLTSTVVGLGTLGYVSKADFLSTTATFRGGYIEGSNYTSTVAGLGGSKYISNSQLTSTIIGLGSLEYISTASLVSTTNGFLELYSSTFTGLGSSKYISRGDLVSTVIGVSSCNTSILTSTVDGLGTSGYISLSQVTSTVKGLSNTYVAPSNLISTVVGFFDPSYTTSFTSTVSGLGNTNYYISSVNPTVESVLSNERVQIVSSLVGLGQTYLSKGGLISTVQELSNIYILSSNLVSTVQSYTGVNTSNMVSTVNGLASLPYPYSYLSSTQLFSTVLNVTRSNQADLVQAFASLSNAPYNYIELISLTSTVRGLSNTYILSSNLVSTVSAYTGVNTSNMISTVNGLASPSPFSYLSSTQLFSTVSNVIPLHQAAFAQVVASLSNAPYNYTVFVSLISTVQGLSNTYILSSNLISTIDMVGTVSPLQTSNLVSTVNGIGSVVPDSYVASPELILAVSNVNASNSALFIQSIVALSNSPYKYIPGTALTSTTANIGTGIIVTANLTSTVTGLSNFFSSNLLQRVIHLGNGASYGGSNIISTTQLYSTVSNVLILNATSYSQTMPTLGSLPYTYISSQSLVSTVTQLNSCNASFAGIPPVVASLTANLVSTVNGIAVPTLDAYIASTQLFSTVSNVNTSNQVEVAQAIASLSNAPYNYITLNSLTSTVQGLGSLPGSYISSATLIASVSNYNAQSGSLTDAQLVSSIANLGTKGYYSTPSLTSTLVGLGTFGYISLQSLVSTNIGLSNIYVLSNRIPEIYSGIHNFSAEFSSTVTGIGSLATPSGYGYISTSLTYTGIPRYLGIPTYISCLYAVDGTILISTTRGVLSNLSNAGYPPTTMGTVNVIEDSPASVYMYTPSGVAASSSYISVRSDGIQMSNIYCSCNFTSYSFNANSYLADGTMLIGSSDRRLKYDIAPLTNALDSLSRLEGVSYRMIGDTRPCMGFIAQDIERVFPQLVFSTSSTKSIKYDSIGVVILEAIKELNIQCDQLLSTMGQ